jgi:hypothetical protein
MRELSNDERNLLRHYAELERLVRGSQRTPIHQHLLRIGFIEEKPVNLRDTLICVTDAGRKAWDPHHECDAASSQQPGEEKRISCP